MSWIKRYELVWVSLLLLLLTIVMGCNYEQREWWRGELRRKVRTLIHCCPNTIR
jgi:hypothetical protein